VQPPSSAASPATTNAPAWHALPADAVLQHWAVDPAHGLDATVVAQRRIEHGPNALPEPPPRPLWRLVARQFASPLIALLFVAAALAVALGHLNDAAVILAVVAINAVIGSVQEGRAERSMAALRRLAALRARVQRGGAELSIEARELVPGDVLLLAAGDAVAADARVLDAAQLQVAEAALTGESVPVAKTAAAVAEATGLADRVGMVHAGTHVAAGRARALVVATGANTEVGRIADLTARAQPAPTPLERRIARFGRALVIAALGLFVLVLLLGLMRSMPLAELLMVAISQMVSMVPEGLPVAMTIALAVGMQRMAARGAVVRRLAAVETLGSTTVICSDKTGTLTKNEMTVVTMWLPDARTFDVSGVGYAPEGNIAEHGRAVTTPDAALRTLLEAGVLCNDAELVPPEDARAEWSVLGDPTEAALLVLARKAGLDLAALKRDAPRQAELPFDADVKLMATRHRMPDAARRVLIKGAPEAVLALLRPDDSAAGQAARAAADAMAARALRVLAFAVVDDDALDAGFDALAGRARLLGLVGQIDPPRAEAQAAVAACRGAGIRPLMITGDHPATGLAIARELGIAHRGERALHGDELERMDDAALRGALPQVAVFARVQPAQKLRIVRALQAQGEVVAMTGDGVNDAPALAQSDIGVAMGRSGTEVAKSAADIVIGDDDFATVVAAVEQGRGVYANLKKVILFLFATSVDEVLLLLAALAAGLPLPLLAVQILWINIVTEGTLTLNLVMDPADAREMRRPPLPRDAALLDREMLTRAALMALTAAATAFAWYAWRLHAGVAIELVRTEVFTLVALTQWFNAINCGSPWRSAFAAGWRNNRWLAGGLALSVLLQAAVLELPSLNVWFYTQPLPWTTLLALLALAGTVLWGEEARKLLLRRRMHAVT
jgi:magnesium-transporting ATPase (P-type)